MKSKVSEKVGGKITKYPCLGINKDGLVVFFIKECRGTTVNKVGLREFGEYENCWNMDVFYKFNGILTLEND